MLKYIEIGGQSRPVRYNQNALEEFEELTGLSVLEGMNIKKISDIKKLAFCGLKHGYLESVDYKEEKPPFTLTDVGRWFDMVNMRSVVFGVFHNDTSTGESAESAEVDSEKKSVGVTSEV